MNIRKELLIVCLAAALFAGCGKVENSDEIKVVETTTTTTEVVTTTAPPETAETTTTTTMTETTTTEVTTTTVTEETTTTTEATTVIEIQTTEPYNYAQPVGNDVLPQSVDNYVTTTDMYQTEPPVTDREPIIDGDKMYTANGYKIEVIDGVTYVGGIIIANKSYKLPQNYGSGLNSEAQQAFNEMQAAAYQDGIYLTIVSGYRSYWYQDQLYWNYVNTRGSQAEVDRFSARAGYSEHQTGLAMDLNNASRSFVGTPEAAWIEAHCVDYGFIVRYPDGKEDVTGFMYEPWHVRYLGKDLARSVADTGLTLEEYFGIDSYYH